MALIILMMTVSHQKARLYAYNLYKLLGQMVTVMMTTILRTGSQRHLQIMSSQTISTSKLLGGLFMARIGEGQCKVIARNTGGNIESRPIRPLCGLFRIYISDLSIFLSIRWLFRAMFII